MNEIGTLALAWIAGGLIGAFFFGGLWWTVRKGLSSKWAALYFPVSLVLRMGVALGGFYVVGRGHWENLAACLLGFIMARLVVTWLTRTSGNPTHLTQEVCHAPKS
jgi:F1F0 ATPase subunit 2